MWSVPEGHLKKLGSIKQSLTGISALHRGLLCIETNLKKQNSNFITPFWLLILCFTYAIILSVQSNTSFNAIANILVEINIQLNGPCKKQPVFFNRHNILQSFARLKRAALEVLPKMREMNVWIIFQLRLWHQLFNEFPTCQISQAS